MTQFLQRNFFLDEPYANIIKTSLKVLNGSSFKGAILYCITLGSNNSDNAKNNTLDLLFTEHCALSNGQCLNNSNYSMK